jgi:hypothetical protein
MRKVEWMRGFGESSGVVEVDVREKDMRDERVPRLGPEALERIGGLRLVEVEWKQEMREESVPVGVKKLSES